jgi:hypothetical protein
MNSAVLNIIAGSYQAQGLQQERNSFTPPLYVQQAVKCTHTVIKIFSDCSLAAATFLDSTY